MKRQPDDFLNDIVAFGEKAMEIAGKHPASEIDAFSEPGMAIILCFEIIGEAVKNVPKEIREKYPHIGWRNAAKMRDLLIHQYWRISFAIILETVRVVLPSLVSEVKLVISELEK